MISQSSFKPSRTSTFNCRGSSLTWKTARGGIMSDSEASRTVEWLMDRASHLPRSERFTSDTLCNICGNNKNHVVEELEDGQQLLRDWGQLQGTSKSIPPLMGKPFLDHKMYAIQPGLTIDNA
ncbi:Hypothetical predicted protein [Pelobates cultripes]|uniref:Uncharacterized protein n=1 Tax=Pelobates cultripes TaxID=61616 RepID=A0AAD1RUN0_PELCU|nr:Hypothetical predicted protein [Pelobates cultripes]